MFRHRKKMQTIFAVIAALTGISTIAYLLLPLFLSR